MYSSNNNSSIHRNVSTSTSPFNFHDFSTEMTHLNNQSLKNKSSSSSLNSTSSNTTTSRMDNYLGRNQLNTSSSNSNSPRKVLLGDDLGKVNNPRRRRSSVIRHISSITKANANANNNQDTSNKVQVNNEKVSIEEEKKKKRLAQLEYIFRDQLKEEEERMKQQQSMKKRSSSGNLHGRLSRQSSSQSVVTSPNVSPNSNNGNPFLQLNASSNNLTTNSHLSPNGQFYHQFNSTSPNHHSSQQHASPHRSPHHFNNHSPNNINNNNQFNNQFNNHSPNNNSSFHSFSPTNINNFNNTNNIQSPNISTATFNVIPYIEEDETPKSTRSTPFSALKPPKLTKEDSDDDDDNDEKKPSIVTYLKNRVKRNDLSEIIPYIDRLNLSYLKYKEIPNDISLFSGLIELNLSHNYLKIFNGMLIAESCPNLINLDLSFNRINNISMVVDLCNLKKLITLNISNNPIRFIDNRIAILQKLLHFKPIQMMDKQHLKDLELTKIRNLKRKPSVKLNHFSDAVHQQQHVNNSNSNNNGNLLSPKSPKTPKSPRHYGKLIVNIENPSQQNNTTPSISITNAEQQQQQQQSDNNQQDNTNSNSNTPNINEKKEDSKFMLHTESSIKKDASLFKSNPIYESQLALNKVKKAKLLITSLRRWNAKRENSNYQQVTPSAKSKIKQTVNSHIPIDMSPFIQSMNQHISGKSLQSVTTTIQLNDNSKSKVIDVKKFRGDDSPFPSLQVLNGFPISAEEYLLSLNEEIYDTCSKSNVDDPSNEKKTQKTLILKDNAKKIKRKIEFDSTVDLTNRKFSLNSTKDLLKRRYLQQKDSKTQMMTYDEFVKHSWVAEDDEFVDEEEEEHLEQKKFNNSNNSNTNNNNNNANNTNTNNNTNGNNVKRSQPDDHSSIANNSTTTKLKDLNVHVTFSDVIKNEFYENRKVTDEILSTKRKSIIDFRPFKEQLLDLTPDQIEMKFKRIELQENSSKFRDQIEHKIDDRDLILTKLKQEHEEFLQKNPKKNTNLVNDEISNFLQKKDDARKHIPKKIELLSSSNTKLNVPYLDKFSLGSKYLEELGMIHDHFNEKSRNSMNNAATDNSHHHLNEDSKKEFEELKALKMTRKKYSLEGKKCLVDGKEYVFSNLFV